LTVGAVCRQRSCRCAEGEKRRESDAEDDAGRSLTAAAGDGWSADERRQGTVSLRTYAAYVTAAGGVVAVLAVLVVSLLAEGTRAFSFWWLAYWLQQGNGSAAANVSIYKYQLLAVASVELSVCLCQVV